ncbi:hypothetical protein JL720_2394 [Aureococcus anophagefferens]|nr:hypothetical protein JL720_2394 [Aureococcus anophagefferens]
MPQDGWTSRGTLGGDLNFDHCNETANDDLTGHCHGSTDDATYGWWIRDHWFRGYAGSLFCCCDWERTKGVVSRCDYRMPVTDVGDGGAYDLETSASEEAAPMAAPAAPVLKIEGSKVTVSFDVPAAASVAVVYFSSSYGKAFYDAELKSVLPDGKTGKVISLATKGAGRKSVKSKSVEVNNLDGGVEYTATVSFRGADDFDFFGPTSPASAPLTIVPPVAPQAPLLEAVSSSEIKVTFAAPPDCANVNMIFQAVTGKATPAPRAKAGEVVSGLQPDTEYEVFVAAKSAFGWSAVGPSSKFRTLSDVEITGARTQEARDAELRKNAIDVDALDPAPAAKRPKKEK